MRVAILGGGFTGLSAGLRLQQKGYQVTIFEKESRLGGLAAGFSNPHWLWPLEKNYHHLFTNDKSILDLANELEQKIIIKRPLTDIFINDKIMPFDSIKGLLTFTPLTIFDRLRVGLIILYFKLIKYHQELDRITALEWVKRLTGEEATRLIWDPLFSGKFGFYKNRIALTWLWARFKKRTPMLAYPEGSFQAFTDRLAKEIVKLGGKILKNKSITSISAGGNVSVKTAGKTFCFDKAVVTLPSPIFAKITSGLPKAYVRKICSIPHFNTLIIILVLKKPFMQSSYWLNITAKNFPFLVLAEHTNFMDPKYYGNQHIVYIANYLANNHPYLKMSTKKLLKVFDPFLKKINPAYKSSIIASYKFIDYYAQPIVLTNFQKLIPKFKTPLKNIYLANLDMVYPWDRGINYAIEMGEMIAKII